MAIFIWLEKYNVNVEQVDTDKEFGKAMNRAGLN